MNRRHRARIRSGISALAILTLPALGAAAASSAATTPAEISTHSRLTAHPMLLAQTATTGSGGTAQGSGGAGTAAPAQGKGTAPAAAGSGVNAGTSAAGVDANTSAADTADEAPQPPKQPAVETTNFGLTIYRGSGAQ